MKLFLSGLIAIWRSSERKRLGLTHRQKYSHDQNKPPSFFLSSISSTGWNRKRKESHCFSVYQPSEPFLFRLGVNNFCKPSWLMREAPSQAFLSGTFQHSVPPAHLWLAGVEKISEQISEFVQFCGGCLLGGGNTPCSLIGSNIMASMTSGTSRNKHLGSWANCAEQALCGSLQR